MARPYSLALAVSRGAALLQIGHCGRTFSSRIGRGYALNVLRPLLNWRRIRFSTTGENIFVIRDFFVARKSLRESYYDRLAEHLGRRAPPLPRLGFRPENRCALFQRPSRSRVSAPIWHISGNRSRSKANSQEVRMSIWTANWKAV